ncbi:MAG: peptide-methionine (S)-S-oxide reductase MsrA [Abitibacteriaceae bacterium]|nr:peptide-methionine (S)-S-oxide reductase MsrA [Abditibacteriaceae bacterium]
MINIKRLRQVILSCLLAVAVLGIAGRSLWNTPGYSYTSPPTAPQPEGRETATFAAGCFWSMEAIFKQLKGVDRVEPGYAGGKLANPSYEQVETGRTGHAETVNITYDPKVISYRDLLHVLLIVRDPTTLNKQGPDEGPQYRSVIFYRNDEQKKAAQEVIQEATKAHVWNAPIVTAVTPFTNFYRAEDYHLNYYNLHPNEPYCRYVIAPEIRAFRARFKSKLKQ